MIDALTFPHGKFPVASTAKELRVERRMSGLKRDHVWSEIVDFAGAAEYLRRKFPHKTALAVADATGLPPDSVKKWLLLETAPCGAAVIVLWLAFGDEFLRAAVKSRNDVRARKIAKLKSELAALERR
jgi:hypothetical protein